MNQQFESLLHTVIKKINKNYLILFIIIISIIILGNILFFTPFIMIFFNMNEWITIKEKDSMFFSFMTIFSILPLAIGFILLLIWIPTYIYILNKHHWLLKHYQTDKEQCINIINKWINNMHSGYNIVIRSIRPIIQKKEISIYKELLNALIENNE